MKVGMNDTKSEVKEMFDRIFWLRKSIERPDKDGYIYEGGVVTAVPSERALRFAKEWVSKMEENFKKGDYGLMEFDMASAMYWLRIVLGRYSLESGEISSSADNPKA